MSRDTASPSGARVFSIPPDAPFLPTLVDAILDGRLMPGLAAGDAAALADATIYLPTRRAVRAFLATLAERGGGRPRLLPRLVPLGDAEDAEFDPSSAWEGGLAIDPELALPPLPPLERRLILTRLIQQWARVLDRERRLVAPLSPLVVPSSPADAVALAGDLEALMDSLAVENVEWDEIAGAVEAEFSAYFEKTLTFLRIAAESWPAILRERAASDPGRRRNAVILAQARKLAAERPSAPIIAAGSTGSVPATATLLAAIARLPNGAVVLPGLDTDLDEAGWEAIGATDPDGTGSAQGHPQALLRRLVTTFMKLGRADIQVLAPASRPGAARTQMISEALRPADTTDSWAVREDRILLAAEGSRGVAVIEAADEREEALCAAIALRETLAEPGRQAMLVTPDRGLARRVASELERWGIAIGDSAGASLADVSAGRLARLAAEAAAREFHPIPVLALTAHPAVRLGWARERVERAAAALEIGVLRGPLPRKGFGGLLAALDKSRADRRQPLPKQRLTDGDWALARELLCGLADAFAGLIAAEWSGEDNDFVALAGRHAATLQALISRAGEDRQAVPDAGEEQLFALFDELEAGSVGGAEGHGVVGRFMDYPAFFSALAATRSVPVHVRGAHARVRILGLLEARLLSADRVVLGGLDEGIWPPKVETDAFLNRPMRASLGLSPPERRIGQTAHDFAQLVGAPDVVITRARKRESRPMVRSRLLERIKAFGGEAAWSAMTGAGERYRALAQALDRPEPVARLKPPRPKPDPIHFPRRLSVTEIETLVRDPYSIFARHVLRLEALDAVAVPPGASDRGTIVHDVFGRFAQAHPGRMPTDAARILNDLAVAAFADIKEAFPELHALWWPRFERVVPDYIAWEEERRAGAVTVHAESSGSLAIPLADGSALTLRGRADRIEKRGDGSFAVVDFKTGTPPSNAVVAVGFSPQMTLEAAMLMRGAFTGIPAANATPDLLYVKIGGARTALDEIAIKPPKQDDRAMPEIVTAHYDGLVRLVNAFVNGEAEYRSRPYAQYARRFSEYDHLARVKEWSVTSGASDESEGA